MAKAVKSGGGTTGDEEGDEGEDTGKRKTPPPPSCVCGCGRRIRVAPTVLAAGPIVCGVCEQEFTIGIGNQDQEPEPGQADGSRSRRA